MKVRTVLTLTAIISSILGATVVYLVLSVPNDLRADAVLKQARRQIVAGKEEEARASLSKVVQQYPRTDAAAAATVALVSLGHKDREDLQRAVAALRRQNEQLTQRIDDLQQTVTEVKNAPPKIVTVQAPPPKVAPKPAPKRKMPTRKRRR
jgi:TolA-binding protein